MGNQNQRPNTPDTQTQRNANGDRSDATNPNNRPPYNRPPWEAGADEDSRRSNPQDPVNSPGNRPLNDDLPGKIRLP